MRQVSPKGVACRESALDAIVGKAPRATRMRRMSIASVLEPKCPRIATLTCGAKRSQTAAPVDNDRRLVLNPCAALKGRTAAE